jgi:hypothetical protein
MFSIVLSFLKIQKLIRKKNILMHIHQKLLISPSPRARQKQQYRKQNKNPECFHCGIVKG